MNKGAGSVYQRAGSDNWWISFSVNGKRTRESSGSSVKKVAQDLLKERNGDTIKGLPVGRQITKTTFEELIEIVQASYKANGHAMKLAGIVKHLSTAFCGYLANQITGDRLVKYSAQRQKEGAANATINRELAILRRAFTLAEDAGKVAMVPKFHLLKESNARK